MKSDDTDWKYSIEDLDYIDTGERNPFREKIEIAFGVVVTLLALWIIFLTIQSTINGNYAHDIYYIFYF